MVKLILYNMLKLKHIHKSFGGVKAVEDCSFAIEPNTITALIGPNGAGKSTVFNIISGVSSADVGQVIFEKKNITRLQPHQVSNQGISRIFQKSRLFENLSVEDNLFLALDNRDTRFWKNLLGFTRKTPEQTSQVSNILELLGINKLRHKISGSLSFGQKRLVEIGRAMINPHRLLILDEPVAGVNPKVKEQIAKLLKYHKSQGKTVLLIEHDMSFTFEVADRIIVLDRGAVLTTGTPEQIQKNKKVLKAYLGE